MAPSFAACSFGAAPLSLALVAVAVAVSSAADLDGAAQAAGTARSLRAQPISEFLSTDVQQALSESLGAGFRVQSGHMLDVQAGLESMWRTMAKDSHGRIDRRSLRYMVQRYFQQTYHLSIIGMEALQVNSTTSAAEAKLLVELIPNFVRSVLEGASTESGFSLEDTAALVAVIERLIEDSGHENLEASYKARGFDVTDLLNRDQLFNVMKHYMLRWSFGLDLEAIAEMEKNLTQFDLWRWPTMRVGAGQILAFEHEHLHAGARGRAHGSGLKESWNPLRPLFSFADAQAVTSGISAQFGRYSENRCEGLMQDLLKSERHGTGRVALSSFHARALKGETQFGESVEYLRQLGALDESSFFHGPQVIASNYVQSAGNCYITHQHFRVCCASPCHDIYSDLEAAIGAPEGEWEDILALVSNMTYGFDDATPRITRKLRAQLQEIAQANHGRVPLHGRLFGQWLHYVFPTECPFPHKSSSISGLSPDEFGKWQATHAEMKENAERGKVKVHRFADSETKQDRGDESDEFMGMWSQEEELLSQHVRQSPTSTLASLLGKLRTVFYALATLSIFVLGVLQPAMRTMKATSECGLLPGKLSSSHEKTTSYWETKSHFV